MRFTILYPALPSKPSCR